MDRKVSRKISLVYLLCVALAAAVGAPSALHAQTANGSIAGTVLDPSGAAVPNVAVTATARDTGSVSKTISTSTGAYAFPDLPPGTYDLTFAASGFATSAATGIEVQAVQTRTVNAKLTVGS